MRTQQKRQNMDRKILEILAAGDGIKAVCKKFPVGKDRVRNIREKGIEFGYLSACGKRAGPRMIPPMPENVFPNLVDRRWQKSSEADVALLGRKDWITERMVGGWSPITIFEELSLGEVGRSSFYRFLHRHDLYRIHRNIHTLVAPIVHSAGEALIMDWGKIRDVVDTSTGEIKTLWAFVGVMGFSRYMMVRLVWTNSVAVTTDAIESMLQELGGVPGRITSDNPKCFSIKADKYDPILNPCFERLGHHYGFRIECLPPQDPKKKGKVERMVPYVRRLFEAHPAEWVSLEKAQEYMDKKCVIANERRHGTTQLKPVEIFLTEEATTLKKLPTRSYEKEEIAYATVRKDGFVRFSNKYYAVADEWIGKECVVLGSEHRVSIFAIGNLIETYDRISGKHETHAIQEHLRKPWQKIEENNQGYLNKAKRIGPNAEAMVRGLIMRSSGFIDTRIIWGLLSLDKKYENALIEEACGAAYEIGKLSSRYVEKIILDLMKQKHLKETLLGVQHKATKYTGSVSQYSQFVGEILKIEVKVGPEDKSTIH